jgi:N-acetylglucosaminyldiphosphoundecaprenol N-acetyl-beta-D-mannosaminyltransferase
VDVLTATVPTRSIAAMREPFPTVNLLGMQVASIDTPQLLAHMFGELAQGRGGWLITANLDFLRRHVKDAAARRTYESADLRVADGMPLVWASRVLGTPLPERVAGSALVRPLCERAAREGRSLYFLGGDPQANQAASEKLLADLPGLKLIGRSAPMVSAQPTTAELAPLQAELTRLKPDFVLVAFGSPKQENVIAALRETLPDAWWIGVGISFSFVSGHVKRAPELVQKLGLEWVHRLVQEPRRLFRRYVIEDLPFAVELFGRVTLDRFGSRRDT